MPLFADKECSKRETGLWYPAADIWLKNLSEIWNIMDLSPEKYMELALTEAKKAGQMG